MRLLCATISLISWGTAAGADLQRIEHPQAGFSGQARIQFPPETVLRVEGLPTDIYVDSYEGEWEKGLARGQGILKARYLPPSAAPPRPGDLAAEGTARALADRDRANAALNARIGGSVPATPAQGIAVVYRGAFDDGMASGPGEVETAQRRLRGQFARWLPEGFVLHFAGKLPVLGETFSRGMPADGPVLINQYPAGVPAPSRTFVGTAKGGKVSGDWFEIAWVSKGDGYERIVSGERSRVVYSNGRRTDCSYDTSWLRQLAATDLPALRGDIESRAPAASDPMYLRNPNRCTVTEPSGWAYGFGLTGTGPFDQKHVPPYTCSDAQGRSGAMTIGADDIPQCSVSYVETKYRWATKIGKALEEAARDARDAVINPLTKVGGGATVHLCAIAQKTPGENCHVNGSVGITLDVPDSQLKKEQRGKEELDRFLAVRKKLLEGGGTAQPFWRSAALLYDACAQSCIGPAQSWSRLSISQMDTILSSSFAEDAKRRQVASLGERLWSVLERYLPGVEAGAAVYSAGRLSNQLFDAKMHALALQNSGSSEEKLRAMMFHSYVRDLYFRHGATSMLAATSETLSLSKEFLLHAIPGVTLKEQITLIHAFGVNQLEFFSAYQQTETARQLVQGLIDAKLKELRLPAMPTD